LFFFLSFLSGRLFDSWQFAHSLLYGFYFAGGWIWAEKEAMVCMSGLQ
jgi:hypothetical protein